MSENRDLDYYKPDYSPSVAPRPNEDPYAGDSPGRLGCMGCVRYLVIVFAVAVLGGALVFFGLSLSGVVLLDNVIPEEICIALFQSCGDEENRIEVDTLAVVQSLQAQAWLETARDERDYDLAAREESAIPGISGELSYRAFVTVTAGIDLRGFSTADLQQEGNTLTVSVPPPQVRDCILDVVNSFFYNYDCGRVGCGSLENELRNTAVNNAAEIGEANDSLLALARTSAEEELRNLLTPLNPGLNVVITFKDGQYPYVAEGGTCIAPPATPTPAATP